MGDNHRAPRAFIFDCDGTLIDSMGVWMRTRPRLLASYGVAAEPHEFDPFEHLSCMGECQAYHDHWNLEQDVEQIYRDLMSMLREGYEHEVEVRPGVRPFLESARAAGIPMAVATSTPLELVEPALEAHGLRDFFVALVTTGEAGSSKERPDVYDLALSRIERSQGAGAIEHGDAWVFEDAVFGLKSSGGAGYRRVGIFDPSGAHDRDEVRALSDIFIDSFEELSLDDIVSFGAGA